MPQDWQQLTKLTGNRPVLVERVRLTAEDTAIEGSFELPPLARLTGDDRYSSSLFSAATAPSRRWSESSA